MAKAYNKVSTGITGFDEAIGMLRMGDNVVWQVDSIYDYKGYVAPFLKRSLKEGRRVVYMHFGQHEPLIDNNVDVVWYDLDPDQGFESFGTQVYDIITSEGKEVFYIFDCLSELLQFWHSDLMIGNFFKITCPYLFELETVAYFALLRNRHTYSTIARIRETTQVLFDLYHIKNNYYVHPLKVWERYSSTMFIPHKSTMTEFTPVTASADLAEIFSFTGIQPERKDHWNNLFEEARDSLFLSEEEQDKMKDLIIGLIIGRSDRINEMVKKYMTLADLLNLQTRQIGTGFIGGKSVGMLLARKILETRQEYDFDKVLEQHDSFYLGSDIFYTYIVQNGWWKLRRNQKKMSGYFEYAKILKEKMLEGSFPEVIREQFQQMLEYFGQSPIIVRSSSLLEDDFGNAFAGKYESVFCVNQGSPEERYKAFENAVKRIYASTMKEEALAYRLKRGLFDKDEQMAILVQRVSGDYHEDYFFPHIAGVGNSSNLYVWDDSIDRNAGMLRLVFGLGTRAVDRIMGDYPRIISLDRPEQSPLLDYEDESKFSQRMVDLLDLKENILTEKTLEDVIEKDLGTDKSMFAKPDYKTNQKMKELGFKNRRNYILGFDKLLKESDFPVKMRDMLTTLETLYDYPVDIEFTANFDQKGGYRINLVQCRPLQTKGPGDPVEMPEITDKSQCLFDIKGNFMGGNVRLPLDYIVHVDPKGYMELGNQGKYSVARTIGTINNALKDKIVMIMGPGRWGTTTPTLGVPVSFAEISNVKAICELSYNIGGFMPELSYGSHFFQDMVESDIFYVAIFEGYPNVSYNPEYMNKYENLLLKFDPGADPLTEVVKVIQAKDMEIYSDIITQKVICK
ncbi:PEP/pyruvate-binding domain-containing protein [Alkalibacter mobilis]|uniref:PEP/pyruvate-binding domain-containing protein n=1 Tax=Alkalibacter mobilis TaxID=2787712 RepID=UPI00189EC6C6|nr:PEP/pyruvate-binding domain-containing protein [Alkalibacter mobilis]MBF7096388.1 pyruvate kinase [Alkalibacter mobilis]